MDEPAFTDLHWVCLTPRCDVIKHGQTFSVMIFRFGMLK